MGKIINNINKPQIRKEEIFFDWINWLIDLYTGLKINAKIIPIIIDNKIGFNKMKDKTARIIKIIAVIICLKWRLSIFSRDVTQNK